jgi:peptide/nickel transport system permease protein
MTPSTTGAVDSRDGRLRSPNRWARDPLIVVALATCLLLILIALFGPLLAPYDPLETDVLAANQGPSFEHLLGTDSLGRDILSRLLVGARLSFLGPTIIVLLSVTFGTLIALCAAWWGGAFDATVNRILNVMFAIPGILLAVIAVAVFGPGFWAPVLALSAVFIPYIARVIKSSAMQERRRPYVEAFQLAGMHPVRINLLHILRNLLPLVLAQTTLSFGAALIDFGALSYLGLGIPQPTPEWGAMINAGRSEMLAGNMQQTLAAGTIIVLTVVAFNLLGERITRQLGTQR